METQVRTPQLVFMQPQRLIVPLFQRPYVWNQESQWAPLWQDVVRVAERLLADPSGKQPPHFLGAVVIQQVHNPVGSLQVRTVIDGQQRLTTLQLLVDALHAELLAVGATQSAMRLEALVRNPEPFCEQHEDQFKVWPTNRDRPAFNAVMAASPPVAYDSLDHRGERLVAAHRYFAERAREWLELNGAEEVAIRSEKIEHSVRELLQLVVIELTADENAQEIFETLNARGAHLTAADLIKNFVFQRLMEHGVDVEDFYERYWKEFETGFWEAEVTFGRLRYSRSSIFLNHWLVARTGEEIVAREVFTRFKNYTDFEADAPMAELVEEISRASRVYHRFVEGASASNPIDRQQLFAYRTSVLESEVFKPVIMWLRDPEQEPVPEEQVLKAMDVLESWLVRRMLVRTTTKSYTQIATELVAQLSRTQRESAGDVVEAFFAGQTVASRYWPDDAELIADLASLPAYSRLRRGRLRMVLEAIEDHRRGFKGGAEGLGGERVARGKYHIEHLLPRKWQLHWPLTEESEFERERLVHTLGNLTLLTSRLNARVSNSAWGSKRLALYEHDVLKMNADLLNSAGDAWNESKVRLRTTDMVSAILEIWPVPVGHTSSFGNAPELPKHKVGLADLIAAGLLEPGSVVHAKGKAHVGRTATILPDGRMDVDGQIFDTPSGAARSITGKSVNGWAFFRLSPTSSRSLSDVFQEYVDQTSADVDEVEVTNESFASSDPVFDGDDEEDEDEEDPS